MPQLFTKSSEHAIKAMLYLTSRSAESPILAREIAQTLNIPFHYLSKVLHQLTKDRLLTSHRGTMGGFSLARPADTINLQDIVTSIDGRQTFDGCLLGEDACGPDQPCPIHHRWTEARNTVLTFLSESTIDQLSKELETVQSTIRPRSTHEKNDTQDPIHPTA